MSVDQDTGGAGGCQQAVPAVLQAGPRRPGAGGAAGFGARPPGWPAGGVCAML